MESRSIPLLPTPGTSSPKGALGKWFTGGKVDETAPHEEQTYPWYSVLWLTGVDYFSSLGYQPGIALIAAGAISPIATLVLVLVTLGGALPIYQQVAKRSFIGQGSIAMLEKLLPGWRGKIFVLTLLGFASTDFIITMTLSASDAAEHLIHNPFLEKYLVGTQLPITLILLGLLAVVFLLGFSEAVNLAVAVGVPYILLNIIVIGRGLLEVVQHPDLINMWQSNLFENRDMTMLLLTAGVIFPKLALGLSGFETGVSVMPLVQGHPEDRDQPIGRIQGTGRLLLAAAVMMSILLLTSSFVATLLIPPQDYQSGGSASGRALAYLAHKLLGETFGTVYDLSTIAILWFAGASAMAGMLNLVPRYLPRFGMAPSWVRFNRPLVLVLLTIDIVVTVIFNADVERQGGAYATGVLVLILSAAVAVSIALGDESRREQDPKKKLLSYYFWGLVVVFAYTLITNIIERPDGLFIALFFIGGILLVGGFSRWQRATELRVEQVTLVDDTSMALWPQLCSSKVCIVPLISNDQRTRTHKGKKIRSLYTLTDPLAFMHVTLRDDRSDFLSGLRVQVRQVDSGDYCIEVEGAVALANTIAYLSELVDPSSVCLGLTRKNMADQSLAFLLFGEGETGIMVYQILVKYWEWTTDDDKRPVIFLMSD